MLSVLWRLCIVLWAPCMLAESMRVTSVERKLLSESYGRPLEYKAFERIDADAWQDFTPLPSLSEPPWSATQFMNLNMQDGSQFAVYKFRIQPSIAALLKSSNTQPELLDELSLKAKAVKVSNNGGIHGYPTVFKKRDVSCQFNRAPSLAALATQHCEAHSTAIACEINKMTIQERKMQSIRNAEAWLNVNGHGHWNHVHHHAGSCWSGVFFIKYDNKFMSDGDLVLKPVPHSNERNPYTPSTKEAARLLCNEGHNYDMDVCRFLSIPAIEGNLIVFPSWLLHGVTPLTVSPEQRNRYAGKRVSLAFNVCSAEDETSGVSE
jgi:hypothetical protein